jgi:hypothetical protein
LFVAVRESCVEKELDTCLHTHTATNSAWSHVEHVKKKASATPHLAKKNKANTKSKQYHKLSCGIPKAKSLT